MQSLERLAELDAPEDVVAWARGFDGEWSDAWNECDRGDVLIWIGGVHGVSLPHLVVAAAACARLPFEGGGGDSDEALDLLDRIEDAIRGEIDPSECTGIAGESEHAADEARQSYRTTRALRGRTAWSAVVWTARAAEALLSAHERAYAIRSDRAHGTAALLGIGMAAALAFTKGSELRLEPGAVASDPIQSELAFVVAAAAEAVGESARALASPATEGIELDEQHELCAAMIREVLGPTA